METVKEMQKRDLVKDIDALIEKQETLAAEAMDETESRFVNGEEYRMALDGAAAANFSIGFLRELKNTLDGLDIKRSILFIRYHAHTLMQDKKSNDVMAFAYSPLSEMLEGLADRADERRASEIDPNRKSA